MSICTLIRVKTRRIYAGSTPGDCYGQFMTQDEANDLVAPSKEDETVVMNWLMQSGVTFPDFP